MLGAKGRLSFGAFLSLLALASLMVPASYGQELKATISGSVVDETQAIIPGVSVTVTNVETGIARTVTTDDQGRYQVSNLAPGQYEVRGELAGFRTAVRRGIQLEMGRTALVELTLGVGEISEQVVVTGDAPLVNTTEAALGEIVSRDRIENLPLNGRSFQQLAQLQPGVAVVTKMPDSISRGKGMRVVAAGTRANYTQYTMDGGDFNDTRNNTPAGALGKVMGVEAVREFKVITNNYSAEFGRNAGALVSITTRSGTNEFHGSVYEFHRNDNLDARNFFDSRPDPPEFKRNQFGFLVEGPIVKNRTFFIFNYEGLRESLGLSAIALTPDADARRGIIPGVAPFTPDPKVKPYADLWPLPNGRNFGNGIGEHLFSFTQPSRQDFFMARVDHKFSERDLFFARYFFDDAELTSRERGHPAAFANENSRSQNLVLEETRLFSPNWVNVARAGYNRPLRVRIIPGVSGLQETIPGRGTPSLDVSGLTRFNGTDVDDDAQNAFQVADDVQYTSGNHNVKFGFLGQNFRIRRASVPNLFAGSWTFRSVADFLRNRPDEVDAGALTFKRLYHTRQSLAGFYVQDSWKALPRLTLNLGLRYEFVTSPIEVHGEIANLRNPFRDTEPTVGNPLFDNPSLRNWAPRLGFAWDPFGRGRTSVRGGFGIFYNQTLPSLWLATLDKMPPFSSEVNADNLPQGAFPTVDLNLLAAPKSTDIDPSFTDFNIDQPYMMHFNLAVQHEVIAGTVVTLGYGGSRGVHLTSRSDTNLFPFVVLENGRRCFGVVSATGSCVAIPGAQRRNPAWRRFNHTLSNRMSFYHSLQASVNKRLAEGIAFQSAYTLSKAIDEGSFETASQTFHSFSRNAADPFDHKWERGLADFDVRQAFVTSLIYDLPFGPGRRFGSDAGGIAGKLVEGWQVSNIVTIAAGSPFQVTLGFDHARTGENKGQRPDLVPGRDARAINPGNPNQYFDVTSFQLPPTQMLGNLGRNTLIGPGVATVDLALAKKISVAERASLQFRAEFFNLFNRANFQVPTATSNGVGGEKVFDRRGNRLPQAARITSTTTTSRQMQFSLKLVF